MWFWIGKGEPFFLEQWHRIARRYRGLAVDDIPFAHIGKGEQSQIQIKVAMRNKAKDVDVVMLEEPENHLSHVNLIQLGFLYREEERGKADLRDHAQFVRTEQTQYQ